MHPIVIEPGHLSIYGAEGSIVFSVLSGGSYAHFAQRDYHSESVEHELNINGTIFLKITKYEREILTYLSDEQLISVLEKLKENGALDFIDIQGSIFYKVVD